MTLSAGERPAAFSAAGRWWRARPPSLTFHGPLRLVFFHCDRAALYQIWCGAQPAQALETAKLLSKLNHAARDSRGVGRSRRRPGEDGSRTRCLTLSYPCCSKEDMAMRDLIPWSRGGQMTVRRGEELNPFVTLHREMNRLFDDVFR